MFPTKQPRAKIYDGTKVRAGTQVRHGAYLAEAIRTTNRDPMPEEVGEEFDTFDGDSVATELETVIGTSVIWGQVYKLTKAHFIRGFYIELIEGKKYRIFATKNGIVKEIFRIESAAESGVVFYPYNTIVGAGQEFALAALSSLENPETSEMTLNYNYASGKNNAPKAGYIHQSSTANTLKIHVTDADGQDQSAALADLDVGDEITDGERTWSILSEPTLSGSVYTFTISPAVASTTQGLKEFTFTMVSDGALSYPVVNDHWLTHGDGEIKGLFGLDSGIYGLETNENAYRINVVMVEAALSPDHIILSYSPMLNGE